MRWDFRILHQSYITNLVYVKSKQTRKKQVIKVQQSKHW